MNEILKDKDFDSASSVINAQIKAKLIELPIKIKVDTYEIRLRSEKPLILYGRYGYLFLDGDGFTTTDATKAFIVSSEMINDTFNRLCSYSIHTHLPSILNGYITMQGGHRAGLSATAVTDSFGNITSLKDVYSVNIRISRQIFGAADEIYNKLFRNKPCGCIITGPPSSGKTTVLRDLTRQLSSGIKNKLYKVCLIDERQEIAAVSGNIAQNDVGINTDIMSCYPKDKAIVSAVKTMSPDIIVIDEVATESEIKAIRQAVNSGITFIVTVHASDLNEILNRPQIEELVNTYSFEKLILLEPCGSAKQIKDIYDTGEIRDEIIRRKLSLDKSDISGNYYFF